MRKNILFSNDLEKGDDNFTKIINENELKYISQNQYLHIYKHPMTYIKENELSDEFLYNIVSFSIYFNKFIMHKKLKINLDIHGAYIKINKKKIYINSLYEQYINEKTWSNEKQCVRDTMLLSYKTGSPKYYIFKHPKKYYFIRKIYCNKDNEINSHNDNVHCELRGWVMGMSSFKNN